MKLKNKFLLSILAMLSQGGLAEKIVGGYLVESWGTKITIPEAAEKGYNTLILAFLDIKPGKIEFLQNNTMMSDKGWSGPSEPSSTKAQIQQAKAEKGLKYVLASVGGENNTFDPGTGNLDELAQKTVDFLDQWGLDGIDFDLEVVPPTVTEESVHAFISALRKLKPNIIIAGAPQVNNVGGKLDFVNSSTNQVYKKALDAGLFDLLFVQLYNTGGNYVSAEDGKLCQGAQPGCYDQFSPKVTEAAFKALKDLVPSNTKLVLGFPATKAAAGTAQIFNGPSASKGAIGLFEEVVASFGSIASDPKAGGLFCWDINGGGGDSTGNWAFVNTVSKIKTMGSGEDPVAPRPQQQGTGGGQEIPAQQQTIGGQEIPAQQQTIGGQEIPAQQQTIGGQEIPAQQQTIGGQEIPAQQQTIGGQEIPAQQQTIGGQELPAQQQTIGGQSVVPPGTEQAQTSGKCENWSPMMQYNKGDCVNFKGIEYIATQWSSNQEPTPLYLQGNTWQPKQNMPLSKILESCGSWDKSKIYLPGHCAKFNGKTYVARQWVQGQEPKENYQSGDPWMPAE